MNRRIGLMGFVLFVVVDVALFVLVRQHLESSEASIPPLPTSSSGPSGSQDDSADPAAAGPQSLELSSTGLMARVSRGRCTDDSRPLIEISADRGASFDEIALPPLEKVDESSLGAKAATVRTVMKVGAASRDKITVIGSDAECRARQFVTKDGGASWKQTKVKDLPDSADGWYVDAAGTGVVSSAGATEPGCDVVALAPVSDRNVKVACSDGVVLGSDDFGDSWVRLGLLNGVTGLSFDTLRDGFAVAPDGGCESRAYSTGDAGGRWEPLGCIAEKKRATALVGSSARLYALVEGAVQVSTDAGEKWSPADEQSG